MTLTHRRRLRSAQVPLSALFTSLAAVAAITGCANSDEPPAHTIYCGDEQRTVLPEQECDNNNDDDHYQSNFIYIGSYGHHPVGSRLPVKAGEQRIAAMDSAARTRAGIPARGGFGSHVGSANS